MKQDGHLPTFAEVFAFGYRDLLPIIPGTKRPDIGQGWQYYVLKDGDLDRWQRQGRYIGIRTGRSKTGPEVIVGVDADTLDERLAEIICATVAEVAGIAEDQLVIRVGRAPKRMYVFQVPPCIGVIGGTVFFHDPTMGADSTGKDKPGEVEVRTEHLQFVAFGIHPDTRQPYQWPNGFPPLADLPVITQEQIYTLLTLLRERLPQARGRTGQGKPAEDQSSLRGRPELVADALKWIPNRRSTKLPDGAVLDYHGWVLIAYALKAALGEDGWPLFELFSESWQDGACDAKKTRATWKGARGPFRVGAAWLYEAAALNSDRRFSKFAALAVEAEPEPAIAKPIAEEAHAPHEPAGEPAEGTESSLNTIANTEPEIANIPARAPDADEATFARLARLKDVDYDRARIAEAKALSIKVKTLDEEVGSGAGN